MFKKFNSPENFFVFPLVGVISILLFLNACNKGRQIGPNIQSPNNSQIIIQTPADKESHQKMLIALKAIKESTNDKNKYLGDRRARQVREIIKNTSSESPKKQRWFHHRILGWAELNLGNEEEGIKHLKLAYDLLPDVEGEVEPKRIFENIFMLGVAWMRRGETENCCSRFTPESCIIPISKNAIHVKEEGSRNAIKYFNDVIKAQKKYK